MMQQQPIQALAAANAANVETMRSLAFASLKATERLMSLNLGFARASLQRGVDSVQTNGNWQQALSGQGGGFQRSAEEAAEYLRGIYDISSEAQADVNEVLSSRVDHMSTALDAMLDALARSAPPGSEKAIGMLRSALAGSYSAYAQMARSMPQQAGNGQAPRKTRKGQ
ncbi:MAG TPA: phasin family protein [Rhodocyclaceae bacterium]